MFTLVLIGSARRLAHRIFFFFHSCFIWNNELLFLPETGIDSRWTKPTPWGTQSSHFWGESLGTREDLSLVKYRNKHSGSCLRLSPLIFWNKSNNHKICKLTELYKRKCIALEQWGDKSQILKFLLVLNA